MRFAAILLASLSLAACAPMMVQQPFSAVAGFNGPRMGEDDFVSFDGARLGLTTWAAAEEPWAVVIGLHGMNDYANAFHMAAPWWAAQGVTTYAYDQRGFGRSPQRGVWAGDLMEEDLRTIVALARARHPHAVLAVVGESMGGGVAIETFASERPPAADRLILLAPAVWGWSSQPLPNKTMLWFAARFTGSKVYSPPDWLAERVHPTDNREELIAMGRDPLMLWGARSDTLYGLVSMMQRASDLAGQDRTPTLYLYGAHDEIIPKRATTRAVSHLRPDDRTIYYPKGWHLLMRDRQGPVVWADIMAFIRDPKAASPSGLGPIPGAPEARPARALNAGL
ncbi:alpha/beta fold hydrolase [Phenylobacterium sp.]|uniref:alpha/beta fold hydrolase n=1 Tax=Phenylobacterium sp. TaxID=1871053 RepID=UPI002733FD60|nr:alpha/beta hydrolase [Phenylobacterium sp.]MDP3659540.1 lysophospholipase [Phenylobacterium sp.]